MALNEISSVDDTSVYPECNIALPATGAAFARGSLSPKNAGTAATTRDNGAHRGTVVAIAAASTPATQTAAAIALYKLLPFWG